MSLIIHNLYVKIDNKEILKRVSLTLKNSEFHALMGPNGSGKSTLAKTIMGDSNCQVMKGQILFNRRNLLKLKPEKRAKLGIFLGFQSPIEIPGVNLFNYLREIKKDEKGIEEFQNFIKPIMTELHLKAEFLRRGVNEGFSGGEKKKTEVLQMAVLQPKFIILDEIDSGLDVDALKIIADCLKKFCGADSIVLLITHYPRILKYLKPNFVHIIKDGQIVKSGGFELAEQVEKEGYAKS